MDAFWFAALFLATAFLPFSSAIECYYCISDSDTRCHDTRRFEAQYQTDQPSECTQEAVDTTLARTRQNIGSPDGEKGHYDCIKIELANRYGEGNRTIIRGCAQAKTRQFDPCQYISRRFLNPADMLHCSVCHYDSCNHASLVTGSFLLIILPLIAATRH